MNAPTKEAMAAANMLADGLPDEWKRAQAEIIDRACHLPELLAVVEAARVTITAVETVGRWNGAGLFSAIAALDAARKELNDRRPSKTPQSLQLSELPDR